MFETKRMINLMQNDFIIEIRDLSSNKTGGHVIIGYKNIHTDFKVWIREISKTNCFSLVTYAYCNNVHI